MLPYRLLDLPCWLCSHHCRLKRRFIDILLSIWVKQVVGWLQSKSALRKRVHLICIWVCSRQICLTLGPWWRRIILFIAFASTITYQNFFLDRWTCHRRLPRGHGSIYKIVLIERSTHCEPWVNFERVWHSKIRRLFGSNGIMPDIDRRILKQEIIDVN